MNINADLVLHNGKIVTMDDNNNIYNAIATLFGKIIFVGDNDGVNNYIGEETKVIDLEEKTVIPGFIDSHSHVIAEGVIRKINIDLSEESGIKSISDIQNRLRQKAAKTPKEQWIVGYQEDDSKLLENRHPTRWELDEISTEHPILVETVGGHFRIVNSKALQMAGITKKTKDPVGGKFDRDPNTQELTGGVHEKAIELVRPIETTPVSPNLAYNGSKEILEEAVAMGLTCVYDCAIHYLINAKTQIKTALELKNQNKLPLRIRFDITIDHVKDLNSLGITQGFGDDWLKICGVKYFFDGAVSARTAAVNEPYLNKPDFYGVMATTRAIAEEILEDAYEKGYRISSHANGDKAIEMYLDIMEGLQKKYPRKDPRNRDIHCTVVNTSIVNRMKHLEILPTIFGPYIYYHGDKLLPAFGEKRAEWMFAARSFLDAGIPIAAHSDHPCAPLPPLMGIHALVNRKTKSNKLFGPSQKISVLEALKLYTINAAYHSFDENFLGSLEVGKLADMVVLEEDILEINTNKIKDIPITMTIIDGKIVYRSLS